MYWDCGLGVHLYKSYKHHHNTNILYTRCPRVSDASCLNVWSPSATQLPALVRRRHDYPITRVIGIRREGDILLCCLSVADLRPARKTETGTRPKEVSANGCWRVPRLDTRIESQSGSLPPRVCHTLVLPYSAYTISLTLPCPRSFFPCSLVFPSYTLPAPYPPRGSAVGSGSRPGRTHSETLPPILPSQFPSLRLFVGNNKNPPPLKNIYN